MIEKALTDFLGTDIATFVLLLISLAAFAGGMYFFIWLWKKIF
jgi:hypothetical protein